MFQDMAVVITEFCL